MKFTTFKGVAVFNGTLALVDCDSRFRACYSLPTPLSESAFSLPDFFQREAAQCDIPKTQQAEFVDRHLAMVAQNEAGIFERPARDGTHLMICQTPMPEGAGTVITCYGSEPSQSDAHYRIYGERDGTVGQNTPPPRETAEWNIRSILLNQSEKVVNNDLKAMNAFLQNVLDALPVRVFWKDRRFSYLGGNRLFLKDADCTDVHELVGKDDGQMPWRAVADRYRANDREVLDHGTSMLDVIQPESRVGGSDRWLRTSKVPIRDDEGEVVGILGSYEDVTEARQREAELARSQAKLQALFDQTYQYIGQLSVEGNLIGFNQSARERFRIDAAATCGGYLPDLPPWINHPAEREKIVDGIARAQKGETARFNTGFLSPKKKRWNYIDMSIKPIIGPEGKTELLLCEVRDITETKEAEKEVRELNETLERRVRERTEELHKANQEVSKTLQVLRLTQDELVQSEKMASLGGLVSGIAHEVNTPIGIGVTAASHLQDMVEQLEAAFLKETLTKSDIEQFFTDAKESTQIILGNLDRAASLVRGFKQVAVDQASEERRRINCAEYVDEIIISLTPTLKKTALSINLDIPDDLEMTTCPGSLAQILTNLILNSITHGYDAGEAGQVTVTFELDGEVVHILYADDGCGMDETTVNRIFDPFFTTRRGKGGSGLGMNIVFNLVTRSLRGRIKCLSKPGQGAQFILSLPVDLEE